jgi:hypothetical protein
MLGAPAPLSAPPADPEPVGHTKFIMPTRDVDLFGVWRPRPLIRDVVKTASPLYYGYMGNRDVTYTINFLLPPEVAYYESITVVDEFPAGDLVFATITDVVQSFKVYTELPSRTIDLLDHTKSNPPTLAIPVPSITSYATITDAGPVTRIVIEMLPVHFAAYGNGEVSIDLRFTVADGVTGVVENEARVYVRTLYEGMPDESDGASAKIVVEFFLITALFTGPIGRAA